MNEVPLYVNHGPGAFAPGNGFEGLGDTRDVRDSRVLRDLRSVGGLRVLLGDSRVEDGGVLAREEIVGRRGDGRVMGFGFTRVQGFGFTRVGAGCSEARHILC